MRAGELAGPESIFHHAPIEENDTVTLSSEVRPAGVCCTMLEKSRDAPAHGAGVNFEALSLQEALDAVIVMAPQGEILHWNKRAEAFFGYSSAEAVGQNVYSLIVPPDLVAEEKRRLAAKLSDSSATTFESLRRRKDGTLVYVDVTSKVVLPDGSDHPVIISSKKDVTSMHVARESKLVEASFRDLLESTPDGIVIANVTGHIVFTNGHAEALFAYGRRELSGRSVESLLPERFRAAHLGHRASFFSQPRSRSMGGGVALFGLRKDGTEFPVEISLSPLLLDGTSLVMSAVRDVSERVRAEQKFRALLESAPDSIVIVDGQGKIELVNSQTETLFGYARAELLGQPVEILLPRSLRAAHPSHRQRYFSNPGVRPMGVGLDLKGRRKDGSEFPVEISLSPMHTGEGTFVSGAIRDITDRKRSEHELREKNVQLELASRAKDKFLATMSHELRTPLNAIIGFTGLLLMRLSGPLAPDQERQLQTVQTSGRHLLSLINNLLDLAKIESGSPDLPLEATACSPMIESVVTQLRPLAEAKRLRLDLRLPSEDVLIQTNPRAFSQIVINLASNAIKFTDQGTVAIALKQEKTNDHLRTEVTVRDSGIGIAPDDSEKLFQAFTQLDPTSNRRYEGTGLGLHLSQRLAALLGGRITLESEIGKGSLFSLILEEKLSATA